MNIAQAQKIPICGYLASQGINPEFKEGNSVWFCSPLRSGEKQSSFKVDIRLNKWVDFGDGELMGTKRKKGGDLLDLKQRMHGVTIPGALLLLESPEIASQSYFSRGEVSDNATDEPRINIKHVQPLQNRALLQYIESRRIAPGLAGRYCKEVYYTVSGKQYFSIGFENDRHGWELRNRYCKLSASPKDITSLPGTLTTMLSVFEGYFDFLSACQYFRVPKPAGAVVILNSVSNLEKVIPLLKGYEKINCYLDNDAAGEKATATIRKHHTRVTDYSKVVFPQYKDFSDFLTNKK
jgi:hypothetical protein